MNKKSLWFHSLLKKCRFFLTGRPAIRTDLLCVLTRSANDDLIDDQALKMLEGVLHVSEVRVGDLMIPRSQMVAIEKKEKLADFLPMMIESHHSRFPVYNEDLDDIEGVLLAKDLLPYLLDRDIDFDIQALLRPTLFVPESKRLNTLLREFRSSKNHIAIVIDEYGHVSGLIALEDILEQIVGEIEDEHDIKTEDLIRKHDDHHFTLKAITSLQEFNDYFPYKLAEDDCDTIGGVVLKHFGRMPARKESLTLGPYTFTVMQADPRRLHVLKVVIAKLDPS